MKHFLEFRNVTPFGALIAVAFLSGCAQETSEPIETETEIEEESSGYRLPEGTAAAVQQTMKVYEVYEGISKPVDGPPTITLALFNRVGNGATYEDAVAAIGAEADIITDDEVGPTAARRRIAQWVNGNGSSATLTFMNRRLVNKVESGLR